MGDSILLSNETDAVYPNFGKNTVEIRKIHQKGRREDLYKISVNRLWTPALEL